VKKTQTTNEKKSPKKGTLRTVFLQKFFSYCKKDNYLLGKMKSQNTFGKKSVLREPFFGDFFWRLFLETFFGDFFSEFTRFLWFQI